MRKIIFIEPKSPNLHIFSKFLLPRLGVFILGAIAKEKGWNVEVSCFPEGNAHDSYLYNMVGRTLRG